MKISAIAFILLTALLTVSCGESNSETDGVPPPAPFTCINDPLKDSTSDGVSVTTRIISHLEPALYPDPLAPEFGVVNTRQRSDGSVVSVPYMVHGALDPVTGAPVWGKALVVLIAGGQLTAFLSGDTGTGQITGSGGNFLVRSAHLYAEQGYRVVTIDQPSDASLWIQASVDNNAGMESGFGSAMDEYRTSPAHAVDLVKVIYKADPNRVLPVILGGTSRGAISAVAQTDIADALALSSPVTAGNGAGVYPVGSSKASPTNVDGPSHVMWHVSDACSKSPPSGAWSLAQKLTAAATSVSGGFIHTDPLKAGECGAFSYHGFLGIESCAVQEQTAWMDSQALVAATGTLPGAMPDSSGGAAVSFNLSPWMSVGDNAALPHNLSALGGSVTLAGSTVTYTPPAGLSGTTDTIAYVIHKASGAMSQGVLTVNLL